MALQKLKASITWCVAFHHEDDANITVCVLCEGVAIFPLLSVVFLSTLCECLELLLWICFVCVCVCVCVCVTSILQSVTNYSVSAYLT